MNTRALTSALLAGLLRPMLTEVNMVNAPVVARERGIAVDETRQSQRGAYETYIRLTVRTERQERSVAGTVFSDGTPRIIQIKGINMEAGFGAAHALHHQPATSPASSAASARCSATPQSTSRPSISAAPRAGEDAIALIEVDEPITDAVLDQVASAGRRRPGEAADASEAQFLNQA